MEPTAWEVMCLLTHHQWMIPSLTSLLPTTIFLRSPPKYTTSIQKQKDNVANLPSELLSEFRTFPVIFQSQIQHSTDPTHGVPWHILGHLFPHFLLVRTRLFRCEMNPGPQWGHWASLSQQQDLREMLLFGQLTSYGNRCVWLGHQVWSHTPPSTQRSQKLTLPPEAPSSRQGCSGNTQWAAPLSAGWTHLLLMWLLLWKGCSQCHLDELWNVTSCLSCYPN